MEDKIKKKIIYIVSNCINISENKLEVTSNSDEIDKWDSLAQVNIIIKLQKEFKKKVPPSDINDLNSISSLIEYFSN